MGANSSASRRVRRVCAERGEAREETTEQTPRSRGKTSFLGKASKKNTRPLELLAAGKEQGCCGIVSPGTARCISLRSLLALALVALPSLNHVPIIVPAASELPYPIISFPRPGCECTCGKEKLFGFSRRVCAKIRGGGSGDANPGAWVVNPAGVSRLPARRGNGILAHGEVPTVGAPVLGGGRYTWCNPGVLPGANSAWGR